MSDGNHSWKRFARAVRQLEAEPGESDLSAGSIPWLSDLPGQVHDLWVRVIWKRWSIVAIALSLGVFGAFFYASQPEAPASPAPRIPIPPAP